MAGHRLGFAGIAGGRDARSVKEVDAGVLDGLSFRDRLVGVPRSKNAAPTRAAQAR